MKLLADPDAKTPERRIPEEVLGNLDPNLGRFQSVDRAFVDLFHAIPTP